MISRRQMLASSAAAIEKFNDHPLNGKFAGRKRDCRQSFYPNSSRSFKKTNC